LSIILSPLGKDGVDEVVVSISGFFFLKVMLIFGSWNFDFFVLMFVLSSVSFFGLPMDLLNLSLRLCFGIVGQ
jgi:hypothetical protein